MGYKLCVTEKPSVAADIAGVIGASEKCDGYYKGNGYIVTWCLGHLVMLCEPEDYSEMYKDRSNIDVLPIIPDKWKTKLIAEPAKRKQFGIIKKLMTSSDCDMVIDCGDMGSQGHYIQWLVRQKAGCRKEVKRFTATSLTRESIAAHMKNLEDIEKYSGVVDGAFCMAKTNWIYGMTFSRLYTSLYKTGIRVGLVKSPVLYMVTKRYMDNKNFHVTNYYVVQGSFEYGGYLLKGELKNEDGEIFQTDSKKDAARLSDKIGNYSNAVVTNVSETEKLTSRPLLYDITELQKDGDSRFGYTPAEVLACAQSLYEKHITTYPRTDSGYITHDMAPYMESRVKLIAEVNKYHNAASYVLDSGLNLDKNIINDKKVEDHHAIIITEEFSRAKFEALNGKEKDILQLIVERMLISFSYPYRYMQTKLDISVSDYIFGCACNKTIDNGYKEVLKLLDFKVKDKDCKSMPQKEQVLPIAGIETLEKETKAPELYTYRTLLSAMSNVCKSVDDKKQQAALRERGGIGTQATRAGILSELIDINYIEYFNSGKNRYLVPSEKGMQIVRIMENKLMSPEITAECELMIKEIEEHKLSMDDYMKRISENVYDCTRRIRDDFKKNVKETESLFKTEYQKISLGKCPFCGSDVVEGKKGYFCGGFKEKQCFFYIGKDNRYIGKLRGTGKAVTVKDMKSLLSKGLIIKCKGKYDKDYRLRIFIKKEPVIIGDSKYVGLDGEPIK